MRFNKHFELKDKHAFFSPSKYHWINYDEDKMDRVYAAAQAAQLGTERHEIAHNLIKHGISLPDTTQTLNMYVNDAIGFRMTPEVPLYYSDNFFGTADALSFRDNMLRVHDLKTGDTRTSVHQLEIYAALFCLEYLFKPFEIEMELRIYQSDDIQIFVADPDVIFHIMDKIVTFDKRIDSIRLEGLR